MKSFALRLPATCLLAALPLLSILAQYKPGAQIDSLVIAHLPKTAPGCVVLIMEKGRQVYKKAFGLADLDKKTPMQTGMVFRTGSIGKQYTAIAILQLVEQGKIKLGDSVQVYVKDFPNKTYPVTIENLLSHTSGIIDFFAIQHPDPSKVHDHYTSKQGVDYFKDEPLVFKPGSRYAYSNSNFYLLGYIVEQVTGEPFGNYLQKNVLARAGLKETYYIPYNPSIKNMTAGYSRFDQNAWENAELQDPSILYSVGGLAATADDVWKWHQALSKGKLVRKTTLDKAYTPFKLEDGTNSDYGFGWFIKNIDGMATVEHSGSTDGYQTNELWIPGKDVFIVTLFNGFEQDMDWLVVTNDIARLATGHTLRKELQLNRDSLQRFTGTYVFNEEHQMVVRLKNDTLLVRAANPNDHLPEVPLHAESDFVFYINEAPLKFEFQWDEEHKTYKLVTYNTRGKDAEWKKM